MTVKCYECEVSQVMSSFKDIVQWNAVHNLCRIKAQYCDTWNVCCNLSCYNPTLAHSQPNYSHSSNPGGLGTRHWILLWIVSQIECNYTDSKRLQFGNEYTLVFKFIESRCFKYAAQSDWDAFFVVRSGDNGLISGNSTLQYQSIVDSGKL